MLYPKKINAKKGTKLVKILLVFSILLVSLLLLINKLTSPSSHWGMLATACIVYVWVTVSYALGKNKNMAAHILMQVIAISTLLVAIDYFSGFEKWSLEIAIPIILMTANVLMVILTMVHYKQYIRYVICQLLLVILSMTPLFFMSEHMIEKKSLSIIAVWISVANFVLCVLLCRKDILAELKRKFHM